MLAKPVRWSAAIRKSPEPPVAVAGEHAARPVGAVRGRRETDEQQARVRVAEAGHGPAPVRVVAMRALLLARHGRQYVAQARTAFA